MRAGRLPIDEQVSQFQAALLRNHPLAGVLSRAAAMNLPGWYLMSLQQRPGLFSSPEPGPSCPVPLDLSREQAADLGWLRLSGKA
jgi:hypothetical protein